MKVPKTFKEAVMRYLELESVSALCRHEDIEQILSFMAAIDNDDPLDSGRFKGYEDGDIPWDE
mgnify:CR=1 FL=1